jgi:hypothetical protein
MKNSKWMGLLTIAILPLYSGCAESKSGYPTQVISSGAAVEQQGPGAPPGPGPEANLAQIQSQDSGAAEVPSGPPVEASAAEIQTSATVPANISPATADVIKMAESGVGEDVLVAYAQKSPSRYDLNADTILYLKDLGIPSAVVTAMITRDGSLQAQGAPAQPPQPVPQPEPQPQPQQQQQQPPGPGPGPQQAVEGPLVQAAQPTYVTEAPPEVNYFYQDLSPYGTWVVLDGVGWCWQPRAVVVNHAWRPYCDDGSWVYTDCGWFWRSSYSWGWAPFHYGRWYMHDRCGWVWTPDRTWGPAWVTWRSYGDTCGWAPLPPHAVFNAHSGWHYNGVSVAVGFDFGLHADHFTFIGVHDFTHHDYAHSRLPATRVRNIYNNTTIINNTTVVNNTIVNRGIPADRVAQATHTKIEKVAIKTDTVAAGQRPRGAASERSGVVYRHEVKAPAQPIKVAAQKVDAKNPVVRHAEFKPVSTQPSISNPRVGSSTTRKQDLYTRPERSQGSRQTPATVPNRTGQTVERSTTTAPNTTSGKPAVQTPGRERGTRTPTVERPATTPTQSGAVTAPTVPRRNTPGNSYNNNAAERSATSRDVPNTPAQRSVAPLQPVPKNNSSSARSLNDNSYSPNSPRGVPRYYDAPATSSSGQNRSASGNQFYTPKGYQHSQGVETRPSSRQQTYSAPTYDPGSRGSSRSESRGNDDDKGHDKGKH